MFLFFTNLWAHLQIFLKKAFMAYYLSKKKMELNLLSLTPTFQRHIHTVSYYEKGKEWLPVGNRWGLFWNLVSWLFWWNQSSLCFFLILGSISSLLLTQSTLICEILIGVSFTVRYKSHLVEEEMPLLGILPSQSEELPWERDQTWSWWQRRKWRGRKFSKAHLHGNGIV